MKRKIRSDYFALLLSNSIIQNVERFLQNSHDGLILTIKKTSIGCVDYDVLTSLSKIYFSNLFHWWKSQLLRVKVMGV